MKINYDSLSAGVKSVLVIACVCTFFSCKRELSYEGGSRRSGDAQGSLQDSVGNCQDITVSGDYVVDSALGANNFIEVMATITNAGKFAIATDTVNGCWFLDTGTVSDLGLSTFVLKGCGKPMSPSFGQFTVRFDGTACHFTIPTIAAKYTFNASAGSCPVLGTSGMYHFHATLNIADSVVVPVTVITPGTYSIQTETVNGIFFSAKGIFTNTGNTTVTLRGNGRPTMIGNTSVPLSIAGTSCNFLVDVLIDTSMYWQFTAEGVTYSGWLDSAQGVLGSTGFFVTGNPNRFFGTSFGGFDKNDNMNGYELDFSFARTNQQLSAGLYHPFGSLGDEDFNCNILFISSDSAIITPSYFLYQTANDLKDFTISVTTCDTISKLFQGTFVGPVYKKKNINDLSGPVINVTNGVFKTYLAH